MARQPYLGWRAQERLKLSSSYLNPPTQVIFVTMSTIFIAISITILGMIITFLVINITILMVIMTNHDGQLSTAACLLNTQPTKPLLHLGVKPPWRVQHTGDNIAAFITSQIK